jgi:hypothetical protein
MCTINRLRIAAAGLVSLYLAAFGVAVAGADDAPLVLNWTDEIAALPLPFHFYGVTLGEGWQGFPAILAPDYNQTGSTDLLDVTLPVFIEWEMHVAIGPPGPNQCPAAAPQQVTPPRPLGSEPWFVGHHSDLVVWEIRQNTLTDPDYHACAAGWGLEHPPVFSDFGQGPFTASGGLRVQDIHGGIGSDTIVWGFRPEFDTALRLREMWVFIFQWNKVATYPDISTSYRINAVPGTAVTRVFPFELSLWPSFPVTCFYDMWSSMLAVEWVSSDIAGATPRSVDAGDIGALSTHLGHPVVWGFDEDGGPAYRNYHANVYPFGSSSLAIDGADISALAADLTETCGLSKAAPAVEKAAILAWFGIAATGRSMTLVNGEQIPEYDVVDWDKNRRAIADPYGYLTAAGAEAAANEKPWSHVKRLYR